MNDMNTIRYIFLLILLMAGPVLSAQEQDAETETEPLEPVMELTYLKDTRGKVNLRASLVNYVDRQPVPLEGLEVIFYAGEDSLVDLGHVQTDMDGMAVLVLEETGHLPVGPDGIRYYAEYEGEGDIWPAEYEIYIMDVNLDMRLELVDSVKTVFVRAWSVV